MTTYLLAEEDQCKADSLVLVWDDEVGFFNILTYPDFTKLRDVKYQMSDDVLVQVNRLVIERAELFNKKPMWEGNFPFVLTFYQQVLRMIDAFGAA